MLLTPSMMSQNRTMDILETVSKQLEAAAAAAQNNTLPSRWTKQSLII